MGVGYFSSAERSYALFSTGYVLENRSGSQVRYGVDVQSEEHRTDRWVVETTRRYRLSEDDVVDAVNTCKRYSCSGMHTTTICA